MEEAIHIYGPRKSRTFRVYWTAAELGITVKAHHVALTKGEHLSEDFKKLNPYSKVPALRQGDFTLFESYAICNYLCSFNPDQQLFPNNNPQVRAICEQWCSFAMTEIDAYLWTYSKHDWIYPDKYKSKKGKEASIRDFRKAAKVISSHLNDRAYLVNDQFSLADIMVGHCLMWAESHSIPLPGDRLAGYLENLKSRPGFKAARKIETD